MLRTRRPSTARYTNSPRLTQHDTTETNPKQQLVVFPLALGGHLKPQKGLGRAPSPPPPSGRILAFRQETRAKQNTPCCAVARAGYNDYMRPFGPKAMHTTKTKTKNGKTLYRE